MPTSTLTSKGQITLPKAVREHLHLATGDRVDFLIADDGRVELRPLGRSVSDLCAFLHRPAERSVAFRELDESLMDSLVEEDDRIRRDG